MGNEWEFERNDGNLNGTNEKKKTKRVKIRKLFNCRVTINNFVFKYKGKENVYYLRLRFGFLLSELMADEEVDDDDDAGFAVFIFIVAVAIPVPIFNPR